MEALWSEPVARGLRARRMSRDTPPWLSAEQVEALDALGRFVEMTGAPALVAENEEHLDVLIEECVDRYQSDEGKEIRRELTREWTVLAPLMEDEAQLPDYSSLPKHVAELLRGADKVWRYVHQKREAWQAMMTLASNAEFRRAAASTRLPRPASRSMFSSGAAGGRAIGYCLPCLERGR